MGLSQAGIEALGFKPMELGAELQATFYALLVYEVQGFILPSDAVITRSYTVGALPYTVGFGGSLNAVCRQLVRDEFSEDEQQWAKEHKTTPPYIVVHLGPTALYSCTGGFLKMEGEVILTYDGFPAAGAEMRAIRNRILPSLETGLSCTSRDAGRPTRYRLVDKALYGITPSGQRVIDLRVEMTGVGYAAVRVDGDWTERLLDGAASIAASLNPKVANLFRLGLADGDPLKKFLYFFLALEIETHRVYRAIRHTVELERRLSLPDRVRDHGLTLLARHPTELRNLVDRFIWCAVCAWPHVADADVDEFKTLKRVRDEIAHGSIETAPEASVRSVEELASKIIQAHLLGSSQNGEP